LSSTSSCNFLRTDALSFDLMPFCLALFAL
jgi:hypothetical protein